MYARRKSTRDKQLQQSDPSLPRVGRVAVASANPYPDEEEISLLDIWRILVRHRAVVLGVMLLTGLAFAVWALLMTPLYRAEVLLAPVTDMDDNQHYGMALSEFGSLAALAGIKLDHKDRKDESIATLQSRRFTEKFIKDRNLIPVLFSDLWDSQRGDWKRSLDPQDIPTLWDAYKLFSKTIRHVREDRGTGLVTLSVEWQDPEVAAEWANGMVSSVNALLRQKAVENSNSAISYLQEQLTRTTVVDLQQVVHRLVESEMKKIILANINEEFAFKVIDPAMPPEEPFRPRSLAMIVLGTVLGLVAGVVLALLLSAYRATREGDAGETPATRAVDAAPR